METRRIEIAPGMTFDVSVDGIDAAPLVLMLHGFGVSRFFWNSQVHALGDAGYFAVAPNQRGMRPAHDLTRPTTPATGLIG
jgi:pimeloyl-ACP methyl ester carboxylesterase